MTKKIASVKDENTAPINGCYILKRYIDAYLYMERWVYEILRNRL